MNLITSGNFANPAISGETEVLLINGLKVGFIEEVISPNGSGAYDLVSLLPQHSIVLAATISLSALVVATTAVKIGLGRKDAVADPNKYALTPNLTAGVYKGTIITVTGVLSSASISETIQVVACDTTGSAVGTLNSGGDITARLTYMQEV